VAPGVLTALLIRGSAIIAILILRCSFAATPTGSPTQQLAGPNGTTEPLVRTSFLLGTATSTSARDGREGRQTIFNHAAYCAEVRGNNERQVMWDRSLTAAQKQELISYDMHHCRCVQVKVNS